MSIPMAVQIKAKVCDSLIAAIAGSNPAENKEVRLFVACALCR